MSSISGIPSAFIDIIMNAMPEELKSSLGQLPPDLARSMVAKIMPDELKETIRSALNGEKSSHTSSSTSVSLGVDLLETPSKYIVEVDAPGVTKDKIKVSVKTGTRALTISYERVPTNSCSSNSNSSNLNSNSSSPESTDRPVVGTAVTRSLISEIKYGTFSRIITLPLDVDTKNVVSNFENGVVRLVFDRKPAEESTNIPFA